MRWRWALAVFAALLVIYGLTASPYLQGGDNAEFATLYKTGGVAHPSGYPLYVLWLRLWSWLPFAPVHGAALATAILAAVAGALLFAACLAWECELAAALCAAGCLALSHLMWVRATEAEVFALHALVAAGLLLLSAPRATGSAFWLGLLAGCGLSNNLSIILLAPLGLLAVWQRVRLRPRELGLAVAGLGIGLLPYLYLLGFPATSSRWAWGEFDGLGRVVAHFLRRDYGTFSLGIYETQPQPLTQIVTLYAALLRTFLYVLWIPALIGFVWLWRNRRAHGAALAATLLVCGPLFISRFNLLPTGLGAHVVARFYLLPAIVAVPFIAQGLTVLVRFRPSRLWPLVLGALVVTSALLSWPRVDEAHRPDTHRYLEDTLASADERAVLLGSGDQRLFGFLYAQSVQGLRPDVVYVDARMLLYPWYKKRVVAQLGFPLDVVEGTSVKMQRLVDTLLASKRPLYFTDLFAASLLQRLPSYPIGTLIRVGVAPPAPAELERRNLALFDRFRLAPPPQDSTGWAAYIRADYVRPWQTLANAFAQAGDGQSAARCRARAAALSGGR